MDIERKVEAIISKGKYSTELASLRKIILSTGLAETIKWGSPVYTYEGRNVVGMTAFKAHFGIWFFQGALLKDSHKKLINAQEGKTKALRQWRMKSVKDIDAPTVKRYIREAVENEKKGLHIESAKPIKSTPDLPLELRAALAKSKTLKKAFAAFTPGKQKEYAEYIESAKRAETKASRIQKIKPMILAGIGLNEKYMKG